MRSLEPQSSEPTGHASPFERQNETESAEAASSAAGVSLATSALKMRAPSRWTAAPAPCAIAASASILAAGRTWPPQLLCVFSRQSSAVRGVCRLGSRIAAATSASSSPPPASFGRGRSCTPPTRAAPATSALKMCAWLPRSTSSVGRVWLSTATRFAIVPLGT